MRTIASILLLAFLAAAARADVDSLREQANAAVAAGEIGAATGKFREILLLRPDDGGAHYQLGILLMDHGGSVDEAAQHFERANDLEFQPPGVAYRLSRIYARSGRRQEALEQLETAVNTGFGYIALIEGESDYDSIRDEPRFVAAQAAIRAIRYPCADDPRHHAFDFWIGEWNVTQNGQFAGTNNIQPMMGHCVIYEQWESATAGVGKSFNYYDPAHDHWRQIWTSDSGTFIEFTGEARDGGIFYTAETINPADGSITLHKFEFTRMGGGIVRQYWETSTDDGQTWTIAWDGRYERKYSDNRFTRVTPDWEDPVFRQYDFWIGLGHANWRQKKPDAFFHDDAGLPATHWVYPTLNGKALLEFAMSDMEIDENGARLQGFSVRYFDEKKERWVMAQEWPDQNMTGGVADQLQGFYRFGRIQVFSTFSFGEPEAERTRRYTFSDIRPEGFIWHGASSIDRGNTWGAGTLVEFSKIEPQAQWPAAGTPFPNYDDGKQCTEDRYRSFDNLAGEWHGIVQRKGTKGEATFTGYPMLGGCAVLSYLEFEQDDSPYTLMEVRSPGRDKTDWWVYRLDGERGTAHTYQIGSFDKGTITLHDNNQYVIEDELQNLTPRKIPRDDSEALNKTVWKKIGQDSLSFEWWTRPAIDAEWTRDAEFSFKR